MSNNGFFSPIELQLTSTKSERLLPACGVCGLWEHCNSPKMPVSGKGKKKILILGESPGANEDEQGIQFCGKSGHYLEMVLHKNGIRMREDCWLTNSIICRPKNNEMPPAAIDYCRPNLNKTLRELKPELILVFGGHAVTSIIGPLWKENPGNITRWVGWQIPSQSLNAWVCPTYHPSFCLRSDSNKDPVPKLLFEKHIKAALAKKGRPWKVVPDYAKQVQIILDDNKAAKAIREIIREGKPIAFDYETNMLKPDSDEAEIVCCSISNGTTTIAYPWYGRAIEASREMVKSNLQKILRRPACLKNWLERNLLTSQTYIR